ncbi:MAG TPA: biotin synthase BioB [Candidatus Desulfovibrio intestinipullorum]|uniref:Biotin synthase n=1 Tax=Candidatus Desulfovibrio intestinipullorum TaxID=2838536 RepID=A0A9D1PZ28_9BACT|nr:biotin synthase BioB [Candidatus Desulfovibrio intestinipullorum]
MHSLLHRILSAFCTDASYRMEEGDACSLAELGADNNMDLLAAAAAVRHLRGPRGTGTCAIINAKSGKCPENCAFCAQSSHYVTGAPVYPLQDTEHLVRQACEMAAHGIARCGLVTSGTALSDRELDALCESALKMRAEAPIRLCASLGLLTKEKARRLVEAGISRYHHNLETARSFFPSVCTTHAYDEDLATLAIARSAGLEVCSCGIFGLGESWAQRVELLQTLREVGVDSLPVNFLCPVPGTPLGSRSPLAPWEALRVVALARLMHPEQEIIICGGRLSTLKDEQALVLTAGASALMSGNYLTTRGFGYADDDALLAAVGTLRR